MITKSARTDFESNAPAKPEHLIVVLDANVFVSALLKDSETRRILISSDDVFLFPEIILEEIEKNRDELLKKSGLANEEFDGLINRLLNYVSVIPSDVLLPYRDEAYKVIGEIDSKDVPYIAAALAFEVSVIWSNDRHFEKQTRIKVLKTKDMIPTVD
jgi:predicted nucleic acid-binding protein